VVKFSQLPGVLNLDVVRGDSVSVDIDFDVSVSGYTVASSLVSLVAGQSLGAIPTNITSAANGLVTVSMTPEYTSGLAAGTYAWDFSWQTPESEARKVLTGFVEVRNR